MTDDERAVTVRKMPDGAVKAAALASRWLNGGAGHHAGRCHDKTSECWTSDTAKTKEFQHGYVRLHPMIQHAELVTKINEDKELRGSRCRITESQIARGRLKTIRAGDRAWQIPSEIQKQNEKYPRIP